MGGFPQPQPEESESPRRAGPRHWGGLLPGGRVPQQVHTLGAKVGRLRIKSDSVSTDTQAERHELRRHREAGEARSSFEAAPYPLENDVRTKGQALDARPGSGPCESPPTTSVALESCARRRKPPTETERGEGYWASSRMLTFMPRQSGVKNPGVHADPHAQGMGRQGLGRASLGPESGRGLWHPNRDEPPG